MDDVTRTVADALQVDIVGVFEVHRESGLLGVRAVVGIPVNAWGELNLASGDKSQLGHTLATRAPVIVEDWVNEDRFEQSGPLSELGARSGVTVPIEGKTRQYGVLGVQSLALRSFGSGEVDFLRAVANSLADWGRLGVEHRRGPCRRPSPWLYSWYEDGCVDSGRSLSPRGPARQSARKEPQPALPRSALRLRHASCPRGGHQRPGRNRRRARRRQSRIRGRGRAPHARA